MMIVYNYHPVTHEFTGASIADPSPLEPGVYLIPAYATTEKPIVPGDNEVAVFEDGEWVAKPDFRRKVFFKKDTKEVFLITEIGQVPDETVTDVAPAHNQKWDEESGSWVLDVNIALEEIRLIRNQKLAEVDGLVLRHQEQRELVSEGLLPETTLTESEYKELLAYKQSLRDMMETVDPYDPVFPTPPPFAENQAY